MGLDRCGGGCPLSCEIDKDHGLDYLFLEYQRLDAEIHGDLVFERARQEELSSILQIEWSDFPAYGHIFSVSSIREWYSHNPGMFYVLRDAKNWVMAYACIVPITQHLYELLREGKYSALMDFPKNEVLQGETSLYYHIEVVASVPTRSSSRVGRTLIREVGKLIFESAKWVTASPVTDIGVRLCKYFGFQHVADEVVNRTGGGVRAYPVYSLSIDQKALEKLERF